MKGYKAVLYENGILRSKINFGKTRDIFEIGIPKQKVEVTKDIAFSENGYSFCGTIEEVANCMDILAPVRGRTPAGVDYRLFLIDTLDSLVIGTSNHYKAEQIVLEKEITQDEIIRYFMDNPKLRANIDEKLWNEFCNGKIQPYILIKEKKDIEELIIENCIRYQQYDLCKQVPDNLDIGVCKKCKGWKWSGDTQSNMKDYFYLIARSKLYNGAELYDIDEYYNLNSYENEQNSLRLIKEHIKNK